MACFIVGFVPGGILPTCCADVGLLLQAIHSLDHRDVEPVMSKTLHGTVSLSQLLMGRRSVSKIVRDGVIAGRHDLG